METANELIANKLILLIQNTLSSGWQLLHYFQDSNQFHFCHEEGKTNSSLFCWLYNHVPLGCWGLLTISLEPTDWGLDEQPVHKG